MNGAAVRPRWPAGVGVAVVLAALAFALALGGWTWRADRLVYDIGLSFWVRIHAPLLDTPTQPVNPLKPA